MKMEKDISDKVKKFISSYWNEPVEKISEDTRLEDDLGITGDDASEFMEEFEKKFGVDLGNFQIDEHFGPEASFDPKLFIVIAIIALTSGLLGWKYGIIVALVVAGLWGLYFRKKKRDDFSNKNVLRVKHLIKAASEKKWVFNYKNEISAQPSAGDRRA